MPAASNNPMIVDIITTFGNCHSTGLSATGALSSIIASQRRLDEGEVGKKERVLTCNSDSSYISE